MSGRRGRPGAYEEMSQMMHPEFSKVIVADRVKALQAEAKAARRAAKARKK
ncbi:hypothetical protein ACQEU3_10200 [Spirillospora sp. CA-253888]